MGIAWAALTSSQARSPGYLSPAVGRGDTDAPARASGSASGGASVNDESQVLAPIDVRAVDFYGDQIAGAVVEGGEIYVPLRPICEYLGLSWGSQRNRIARDEVLQDAVRGVFITNTPGP